VKGDRTKKANETFFVNIARIGLVTIVDGQGQGTIEDDDAKPGKGPGNGNGKITSSSAAVAWLASSFTTTKKRR
jgi:hypothetical protein